MRNGETAGQVKFRGGKPVSVSLMENPSIDTLLHELGHVFDYELERRAHKRRWYPRSIYDGLVGETVSDQTLLEESQALAAYKYPLDDYVMRSLAEQLDREGKLELSDQRRLSMRQAFFADYAATLEEGFANAFALHILDPEKSKELAPEHHQMIVGMINDEPDLKKLIAEIV